MIDFHFEDGCTEPTIELFLPQAMEGTEGVQTLIALASVYQEALTVAHSKNLAYGDAWRRQGWMGNLARMMSKMARLKNLCWRDHSMEFADESVSDSALDMVNITSFFIVNRSESNKWGTQ